MNNSLTKNPAPFILASMLASYPDEAFAENIQTLMLDESISIPDGIRESLAKILSNPAALDDLRSEYIDIFDRSKVLNPLYETEYGRERAMFKANELSDIAGFYRAFGFELSQDGVKEMLDHVSVELEFYALLMIKELHLQELSDQTGIEIVRDARRKFLTDHLGRFAAAICDRPGVQQSLHYSKVFEWCRDIVSDECMTLDVKTDKAQWMISQVEGENVCCGESVIGKN